MFDDFSKTLSSLSKEAEKVVREFENEKMTENKTVILHPRVWKDKKDAEEASKNSDFRKKMEIIKQFEEKVGME